MDLVTPLRLVALPRDTAEQLSCRMILTLRLHNT